MTNLDGGKDIQILILNLRDPFEEPEKDKPIHPTYEKLKKEVLKWQKKKKSRYS